jgi:hypothetical protein
MCTAACGLMCVTYAVSLSASAANWKDTSECIRESLCNSPTRVTPFSDLCRWTLMLVSVCVPRTEVSSQI